MKTEEMKMKEKEEAKSLGHYIHLSDPTAQPPQPQGSTIFDLRGNGQPSCPTPSSLCMYHAKSFFLSLLFLLSQPAL